MAWIVTLVPPPGAAQRAASSPLPHCPRRMPTERTARRLAHNRGAVGRGALLGIW